MKEDFDPYPWCDLSEYPGTNIIEYQFPLRPGLTVRIALPNDMTESDVMRITNFLSTLVIGDERGVDIKALRK